MTNLIVSMLRFSAALTLYGVEQLERSTNVMGGGTELGKNFNGLAKTLDSLTDVLTKDMDQTKKETLDSVSKASHDMVNRTMEGMDLMDPRQVLKTSSDLLQKTTDVASNWVSIAAEAVDKTPRDSQGRFRASVSGGA
jgi:hypothetical protein